MSDHAATLAQAQEKVEACESLDALKAVEREYLGKDGLVAELLARIPALPNEEKPAAGREANVLKQAILQALDVRRARLAEAAIASERSATGFDPSLPPPRTQRGTLHPITQVTRELEDLFHSMGYSVLDGPEVEAIFTSPNFDVRSSSRGPTFTRVRGRSVVSDRIVELIDGAESSILVASGHMRSRPIADALIRAKAMKPERRRASKP